MSVARMSAGLLWFTSSASAATWIVDDSGGADFTSIQAAIDAAASGDRIEVRAGTYTENALHGGVHGAVLKFNKSVEVVGAGVDEVIVHANTAPVGRSSAILLSVGAYTASLQGMTLVNARNGTDNGSPYGDHFSYTAITDIGSDAGSFTMHNVAIRVPNNRVKAAFYKNNGAMAITVTNSVIDLGDSGTVGMYGYANASPMNVHLRNSILRNCNGAMNPGAHGNVHYTLIAPSSGSAPSGTGNLHGVNGAVVAFTSPSTLDYTLQPSSSAINAGDPAPAYNDPDGSRNDMGVSGGPGASACPATLDETLWAGVTEICLHPMAVVSARATFGDGAQVWSGATVHPRADVGAGAVLGEGAVVGRRAHVGAGADVGPGAFLAADVDIDANATIGDTATIGFGASISGTVGASAKVGNLASLLGTAQLGAGSSLGRESSLATGVVVGTNVRIDANVQVQTGVSIGNNARVRAGSCVGENVPALTTVRRGTDTCP